MATPHLAISFDALPTSMPLPEFIREFNRRCALLQKALSPVTGTLRVNNPTPSVAGSSVWQTANTSATTITAFLGGTVEQEFVLIATENNTTLQQSSAIMLTGGVDLVLSAGDLVTFVTVNGTDYLQVP